MKNKDIELRFRDLETSIHSLKHQFKELELDKLKKDTKTKLEYFESKYNINLQIEDDEYYNIGCFFKSYFLRLYINGKRMYCVNTKNCESLNDIYHKIDFSEIEEKIKAYLYDNNNQNKSKKSTKKLNKKEAGEKK